MEYTVDKLARLSGVSPRTLRYYDSIGLLKPARVSSNGYRIYGGAQAERLREILFYRELDVRLEDIAALLDAPGYDREKALRGHLQSLRERRDRTEALIKNLERTLRGDTMTDSEKFEGFKKELVEKNEKDYGAEARGKYGDEAVNESNEKLMGMTREQYEAMEALRQEINDTLREAMREGDPKGATAQRACELHKKWLCLHWGEKRYSKAAHLGLAEMYIADERFTEYWSTVAPNAAQFLKDALAVYCA